MFWPFSRRRIPPPTAPEEDWWVEVHVSLEGEGVVMEIDGADREVQGYITYVGLRCAEGEVREKVEETIDQGEAEIVGQRVDINELGRDIRRAVPDEVPTIWCQFGRIYY